MRVSTGVLAVPFWRRLVVCLAEFVASIMGWDEEDMLGGLGEVL